MNLRIAYLSQTQLIAKHEEVVKRIATMRETLDFIRGKTNLMKMRAQLADAERQAASIAREMMNR